MTTRPAGPRAIWPGEWGCFWASTSSAVNSGYSYRIGPGTDRSSQVDLERRSNMPDFIRGWTNPWTTRTCPRVPWSRTSSTGAIFEGVDGACRRYDRRAESRWIKLEIDTAVGALIPVLPIVVGEEVSRFITLSSLRRRVPVERSGVDGMSDADSEVVLKRIEDLLLEAYRRRLRTTSRAEEVFRRSGYDWALRDPEKQVYFSSRGRPGLVPQSALSHCSVLDVTWIPPMKSYKHFLAAFPGIEKINQKIWIYDREGPLSDVEMETVYENLESSPFIIVHCDELPLLLSSNFSSVR